MSVSRPSHYKKLASQFPEYAAAVESMGKACKTAGPISEKTIQLIQLSASAAIRSEGAVHSHARRALQAGATKEEIQHCLLALTSTVGFPTVMAALCWVEDVLEDTDS